MATMRRPQVNPQIMAALAARAQQGGAPVAGAPGGGAAMGMPGPAPAPTSMKRGGKTKKMAKGGSASARADGIATRGLTKGTFC